TTQMCVFMRQHGGTLPVGESPYAAGGHDGPSATTDAVRHGVGPLDPQHRPLATTHHPQQSQVLAPPPAIPHEHRHRHEEGPTEQPEQHGGHTDPDEVFPDDLTAANDVQVTVRHTDE